MCLRWRWGSPWRSSWRCCSQTRWRYRTRHLDGARLPRPPRMWGAQPLRPPGTPAACEAALPRTVGASARVRAAVGRSFLRNGAATAWARSERAGEGVVGPRFRATKDGRRGGRAFQHEARKQSSGVRRTRRCAGPTCRKRAAAHARTNALAMSAAWPGLAWWVHVALPQRHRRQSAIRARGGARLALRWVRPDTP